MLHSDLQWIWDIINTSGEVFITLWATPGKPRTQIKEVRTVNIDGTMARVVRMDVAAPPERGRANQEILKFFASLLDFPVQCSMIAGQTAKHKILKIARV